MWAASATNVQPFRVELRLPEMRLPDIRKKWLVRRVSPEGKAGLVNAAKGIAYIACDLITQPEKLKAVQDEFKKATQSH